MNWFVTVRHQPVHQIKTLVVASGLCDRFSGIHGFRLLRGLREAAGERVGATVVPGEAVSAGVETRNAKVGDGAGKGVPEGVDEGDGGPLEDGEGLGVGLGVGEGTMFSQRCNGTLAPPISFTSVSHRAWILSKSGGPNGFSAVPGKMM